MLAGPMSIMFLISTMVKLCHTLDKRLGTEVRQVIEELSAMNSEPVGEGQELSSELSVSFSASVGDQGDGSFGA